MSANSDTNTAMITLLILKFVVLVVWPKLLIGVVTAIRDLVPDLIKSVCIVLFHTLAIQYYSTPNCILNRIQYDTILVF